jgi:hypothetical protein
MSAQEIAAFYKKLGLDTDNPTKLIVTELPQFTNAENPRVQYIVRLSGSTKPPEDGAKPNA